MDRIKHRNMSVFRKSFSNLWASLIAQLVKKPPAVQETLVQFLDWKDLPNPLKG